MNDDRSELMKDENFTAVFRKEKLIIYVLLCITAVTVCVNNLGNNFLGFPSWYIVLPAVLLLLAENAVKMWGVKGYPWKGVCYVVDILILLAITTFTNGELISTFYMVILSEFYLSQVSLTADLVMGASSIGLYLVTLSVSRLIKGAR